MGLTLHPRRGRIQVDQEPWASRLWENRIRLHRDTTLLRCEHIFIGCGTTANGPLIIKGKAPCRIGRLCAFGWNITIQTTDHDLRFANLQGALAQRIGIPGPTVPADPVVIGSNVWLADNVNVLRGVTIGDGAVIGCNSVVTKDIPPFAIAVGTPAKVIRYRFSPRIIEQLLEIKWWDWTMERIRANTEFFLIDLTENPEIDLHSLIRDS